MKQAPPQNLSQFKFTSCWVARTYMFNAAGAHGRHEKIGVVSSQSYATRSRHFLLLVRGLNSVVPIVYVHLSELSGVLGAFYFHVKFLKFGYSALQLVEFFLFSPVAVVYRNRIRA